MKKLWQTTTNLHPQVESYTVGEDYLLDQQLLPYDVKASQAHATMLAQLGVLTSDELESLNNAFDKLLQEWQSGKFKILPAQEDGHTAIEQYLIDACGDLGKKIHTARSRNDQALVMMRLYEKEMLGKISHALNNTTKAYYAATEKFRGQQMPGYTHMQKAMPTTVDTWLGSFADGFADIQGTLSATRELIDQNPLGSASGFGIANFPIPKHLTTTHLEFAKTQQNPMYCGISRGLFEAAIINSLAPIMILSSRFASDMLLFATDEFNFFSLPREFTTGSSIMPNKQNYDLFEIMRANWPVFASYQQQVQNIVGALPSGYSRDLQLTKKPVMQSLELALTTLQLLAEAVSHVQANTEKLNQAMSSELFATEKVYELVKAGHSFRDAYGQIKENMG